MLALFQDDIEVISLVYNSFLLEFPLCYGYWIKYAAHKAWLCKNKDVVDIYEQAVQAVPHSVDLWVSYCGFGICAYEEPADIRRIICAIAYGTSI
jgi:pre-mRNA-processing factor 39